MIERLERPQRLDEEKIAALKELFPAAFREGRVNLEALKEELGDAVDELEPGDEHYGLNWPGKRAGKKLATMPPSGTLVPVPGEGVDESSTQNLIIEGENLEVLRILQKAYAGRVKLIYIDPPYNTGRDFIYNDNYSVSEASYLDMTNQTDVSGLLTSNPKSGGRYHSKWLDMMYSRLTLARNLLHSEGVIFISLDDNEIYNLRTVTNEIFGEENFVATVIWQKVFSPKNSAKHFSEDHDYIAIYAKDAESWRPSLLPRSEEANSRYSNPDNDPRGDWTSSDLTARNYYADGLYEVKSPSGERFEPPRGRYWAVSHSNFHQLQAENRIWWGESGSNMPRRKRFLTDVQQGVVPQTLWLYKDVGHTQEAKKELIECVPFENTDNVIDSVKPTRLLQRILQLATQKDTQDIVLDFFAGTGSTLHAVLKQNGEDTGNRRFIGIQIADPLDTPETKLKTISDVTKERVRSVSARFRSEEKSGDLGFRVLKLSKSNIVRWRGEKATSENLDDLISQMQSTLVPGWKTEDVLTEIKLLEGYPLDSSQQNDGEFSPNQVFTITHPDKQTHLLVCLDANLEDSTVERLVAYQNKQLEFICLDSALTDQQKQQLADVIKVKTI